MTDEQMDARLRAAGAAWRAATDEAPHTAEPLPVTPPARARRPQRTAWLASAAVVAAALVAGGAFVLGRVSGGDGHRGAATESAALQGRVWRLTGYQGDQQRTNGFATLYVGRDGHLVADDTCQLIEATVTGTRPSLRKLQIRNYNCTDAVGEVSFGRGLRAFQDDPRFVVDGDRLTISGGGVVMHLAAAPNLPVPTADRPTLTDATWRLTAVVDANGKRHAVQGNAGLRIDGDQLSASDTCNSLSGTVKIDYPILKATGFAQTAVGCPDNDTAPVVDAVLGNGARIDFRQATLTVTKTGAGTLTYQWQPSD